MLVVRREDGCDASVPPALRTNVGEVTIILFVDAGGERHCLDPAEAGLP